uniref:DNA-directed RNA polymerase subunit beta n=1 Tax=Gloeochaete wittrockiana TaxID=38269 RepID=A0A3G1IVV1_9EUKA|nr:RNA polymerase beta subunit [Gloeochaete wittrockiana]ASQ40187.1 RNA polymerase beta subunit [Gloeochaete wittrockiana]
MIYGRKVKQIVLPEISSSRKKFNQTAYLQTNEIYKSFKDDTYLLTEYPKINELLRIDLLDVQKSSYIWFLKQGFISIFDKFSIHLDNTENFIFKFFCKDYFLRIPKRDSNGRLSKKRGKSFLARIFIPVLFSHIPTGVCTNIQEVFVCFLPFMTKNGSFIVNGTERTVINQLVRSPGIYFKTRKTPAGFRIQHGSVIPNYGSWLRFEIDKRDLVWIQIDNSFKIGADIFLKALGFKEEEILKYILKPFHLQRMFEFNSPNYTQIDSLRELDSLLQPLHRYDPSGLSKAQEFLFSRFFDSQMYDLGSVGRAQINKRLRVNLPNHITVLTPYDILAGVNHLINLEFFIEEPDDIDHLSNRRMRSVGELLQNQIRIGLNQLKFFIQERLRFIKVGDKFTKSLLFSSLNKKQHKKFKLKYEFFNVFNLRRLINPKPLSNVLTEFFGSSQLSQFLQQTNPLAELTHKRRLTVLGPGGIDRDAAGIIIRDIHPSYYGRICPVETSEGKNVGLVGSLAIHAKINRYGFLQTPYYRVYKGKIIFTGYYYLTADQEENYRIAPADIARDRAGHLVGKNIPVRYRHEFISTTKNHVDFINVSTIQPFSISTVLIPFLEHDDANRALMGSNMQRQAVPLLFPERCLVGTGFEIQIARDSGWAISSSINGFVSYVSSKKIIINNFNHKKNKVVYFLRKYERLNPGTCLNQKPSIDIGDKIYKGQVLTNSASIVNGELALGRNILIAYMPWDGYNYEDAILLNEQLIYNDVFTSLHITHYEVEALDTKQMMEEITKNIPHVDSKEIEKLDKNGIVKLGTWVESGDILVGKITPLSEAERTLEWKLMRVINEDKTPEVKDTSLRLPRGVSGHIIDIKVNTDGNFKSYRLDKFSNTKTTIRIYVIIRRRIKVGDKLAGRHGNKGIISKIVPRQDMPYLSDGQEIQMVLNPLGVPSRMNVGQVYECLLGWAAYQLGTRFKVLPFDEMYGSYASQNLVFEKINNAINYTGKQWFQSETNRGKTRLFDGRTGEAFNFHVTVGQAYILKLIHLVDEKIHARSTGPYALVTQQPLGGKSRHGGQRLGEMEVWALEAFGVAYTLQELLTIKSDDMGSRSKALYAMTRGLNVPDPGIPESFKVLLRELHSLCLDISPNKIGGNKLHESYSEEFDLVTWFYNEEFGFKSDKEGLTDDTDVEFDESNLYLKGFAN